MHKDYWLLILLLLCLTIIPGYVFAQTVPEEARRHMVRGLTAAEMAKSTDEYDSAVREFKEAARLAPYWPDPQHKLGLVLEKSGKFREAVASFKEYLRLAPGAPDAVSIKELVYKLEYKAEQILSIPDIIEVLVSDFSLNGEEWDSSAEGTCRVLVLSREGSDTVKAMKADLYYPTRSYSQTLKVTGPVLKYITTINVCDVDANRASGGCDSVMENEIEVVSKRLVKINQKVLRGGYGAGVSTGQRFTCTFRKK